MEYTRKQYEYKEVLSAVISLSYFFLFDQDLMFKLKNSDVDLRKRRIRNLRADLDNRACKWLTIDEKALTMLEPYILTRKLHSAKEPFLYIKGQPANNPNMNYLLSILKNKANFQIIQTTIDIRKIIRSRISLDLELTEGKAVIDFLKIMGLKRNTHLDNVLEKFLLKKNNG